ncbi:MAG TPA: AAA family ATPase [Leptospiraceae bacterium]|nr:AAA family ATPase [Leptospiraceae bacterium]HNI96551.1 AAA family ATPase [Leptospiraceae bacterium]HNM01756.1 AAA family ATPase [Leptospiraceae bacterium]
MNDAQNLKSEFMEWYIGRSEKTDGYFRRIFHGKPEKLESELDEYSEFFDFSIFDIGENNYKKYIKDIQIAISDTESDFFKYSRKTGHHRPKFILGNENYLKFLKEKFRKKTLRKQNTERHHQDERPLNLILYGPPGTGKTYNALIEAVKIANPSFNTDRDRKEVKAEFDRLRKEGRIVFTTFHQSMSYEDFIEGIRPIEPENRGQPVIYRVIPGILKEFCDRIRSAEKRAEKAESEESRKSAEFNYLYSAFIYKLNRTVSQLKEGEFHYLESRRGKVKILRMQEDSFLTMDESADVTETVSREKLQKIYERFSSPDEILQILEQVKTVGTDSGWSNNSYAAFIALKAFEISYRADAEKMKRDAKPDYAIIIDEINRGNVSQIFGEIITLIEEDKRLGREESLEVTLPGSREKFGIPASLFIIGTMNTADRSVEALDTALRRRFSFRETLPESEIIAERGRLKDSGGNLNGISLPELLDTMNRRIERLLDRDHLIGHSYFMSVSDLHQLKIIFQNRILPLLQEYFYGDYGKIGLVLGKGFLEKEEDEYYGFADFYDEYDGSEYMDRAVFRIKNAADMDDEEFLEALQLLLNRH